jgi:excisionase family DNA binding protein
MSYHKLSDTPPTEPASNETIVALLKSMQEQIDRLERGLAVSRPKETYTTDEAAERLNRSSWTVRDWCNNGQVPGAYKVKGKGRRGEWRIPHDALVRVQNEGPAAVQKA